MHKKHSQESPVFSKVNLQRYRFPWLFCSCLPVKFSKFQRILDLEREKKNKNRAKHGCITRNFQRYMRTTWNNYFNFNFYQFLWNV